MERKNSVFESFIRRMFVSQQTTARQEEWGGRRGGIDAARPIVFHHSATWKPDMLRQSRALRDLRMQKRTSSVFCKLLTGTFFLTMSKDSQVTRFRKKSNQVWHGAHKSTSQETRLMIRALPLTPMNQDKPVQLESKQCYTGNKAAPSKEAHNCNFSICLWWKWIFAPPIWELTMGYLALWAGMKPHLHAILTALLGFKVLWTSHMACLCFIQIWDLTCLP